jgi:branched-chain amino acid transport system ATP-binding protein
MALLELSGITKRFGGLVACNEVSLVVNEGEIVGLIGPNGAGKTTLFNCITGYYRPDGGTITFDGQNITDWSPDRVSHRGLARTFQVVRTFKEMTVLENVMIGSYCRVASTEDARKEALRVLEFTGLLGKKDALGAGLTVADKKRLELTRALATRPRLIMLDEAMAGLNQREVAEAIVMVKAIRDQGVTVFLVEHVMEAIMPISDRVIVLNYGERIAEGTPAEVCANEEVIKAYLGEDYRA